MAAQPQRPWFRLASLSRPSAPSTPAPTPAAPEPAPAPPRPPLVRPPFRPISQLQPPPPPPAATAPPPPPLPQPTAGASSVPSSPVTRPTTGLSSVPASPAPRVSAPSSPKPAVSSLPPSPAPKPTPISSSLPPSPAPKPTPVSGSVPPPPTPKTAAISSSVPPSPTSKPTPTTSFVPPSPARNEFSSASTRMPSPRTIKPDVQTPPHSPKPKPIAPPPSPLALPPPQIKSDGVPEPKIPLEAEKEALLVEKTVDRPKGRMNGTESQKKFADSLHASIASLAKKGQSKDGEKRETVSRRRTPSSDSEDSGMRVITIAGENKGAYMEVIHSPKKGLMRKPHFLHKRGNANEWGSHGSGSSGEEGESKKKEIHKGKAVSSAPPPPLSAFMNSNVQGINNSIVYNSSCSHHDPGVHLALSRKSAGAGLHHVKERGNGYQT